MHVTSLWKSKSHSATVFITGRQQQLYFFKTYFCSSFPISLLFNDHLLCTREGTNVTALLTKTPKVESVSGLITFNIVSPLTVSVLCKINVLKFRMKEEMLRLAWQKRGLHRKRINLNHDYTPDVLKKRREYAEAKSVLKEERIRFQTLFPPR